MMPLQIYIGWDAREQLAWHVLAHSILSRTSYPVSLIPLHQQTLRQVGLYQREPDHAATTEFSLTRFLVPALSGFKGYSLFLDCDMLCQANILNLFYVAMSNPWKSCWIVKHDYIPKTLLKMDGCPQTTYPRKNWSSVMLFNNELCRGLTAQFVDSASPADLHRFAWVPEHELGELSPTWNWLVGEYRPKPDANILHYTLGGPWFPDSAPGPEADRWIKECEHLGITKKEAVCTSY